MSESAEPLQRGAVRTVVLLLLTITIPILGLLLGGIEMGYRNYRFGVLLILLALFCPSALWNLLRAL